MAYEYAANVYSLEEWTFSLRSLHHIGGGLYMVEGVPREGYASIYVGAEAYPDSRVVDYPAPGTRETSCGCGITLRFVDARPTIRKPAATTSCLWTNVKHPYYDRATGSSPITSSASSRARTDRAWVGDIWPHFDAIHKIEIAN